MRSAADGALAGLAVTGRAGSVVNVRRCDMVRVPGGWCGASVEAWNGRRGHDVMTGPVCEECEQAQQRCRRQTSAPDDKSRPVSLASGRRARGCPRTCGTRCRSSATARSSNRAAIGRQCAKEGPGLRGWKTMLMPGTYSATSRPAKLMRNVHATWRVLR